MYKTVIQCVNLLNVSTNLKLQGPGPEPKWDGVFEAINENIRCKQSIYPFAKETRQSDYAIIGRDNCLTLNVYTPVDTTQKDLSPVMVFIHGGGFLAGSGSKLVLGPEYLTRKGIVLVTINYRLNVEGFLCLGIKEAPGNAGLKDQVAALRWVQRNIEKFGGDPDNVTLFGESAGAASVSLHVLSPMSKGLFRKAIQQSGSSLSPWAFQFEPIQKAVLKARAVGYSNLSEDAYDLYTFFNNKTTIEIITNLTKRTEGNALFSRLLFTPCIENNIDGVEAFLTEPPYKILYEGRYNKVPMITGSNSEEGLVCLNMESDEHINKLAVEEAMSSNLVFPNVEAKKKISDEVVKLYMGEEEVSVKTKTKWSKFYGESFFNYPVLEETELFLKTNDQPMYNYYFNYSGWRNLAKLLMRGDLKKAVGAAHADELFYMFSQDIAPSMLENKMIEVITTMWTNFAKYG